MCEICEEQKVKLLKNIGDSIYNENELLKLIDRKPSWSDTTPYSIQDDDNGCEQINVVGRTWVVDVLPRSKFDSLFRTTRKLLEFHSCGMLHIPDEIDNEDDD